FEGCLLWWPLAITEDNIEYFIDVVSEQNIQWQPIPPELIVGKALRLVRRLAI
ncbi:MAG: hypothetical protein HOC26_04180, partial [Chloroflexi bacterium]|nr:hypothetical protein [Chloroflexota bacterium]